MIDGFVYYHVLLLTAYFRPRSELPLITSEIQKILPTRKFKMVKNCDNYRTLHAVIEQFTHAVHDHLCHSYCIVTVDCILFRPVADFTSI